MTDTKRSNSGAGCFFMLVVLLVMVRSTATAYGQKAHPSN